MGAIPKDSLHRPNLPLEALVDILLAMSLGSWEEAMKLSYREARQGL